MPLEEGRSECFRAGVLASAFSFFVLTFSLDLVAETAGDGTTGCFAVLRFVANHQGASLTSGHIYLP